MPALEIQLGGYYDENSAGLFSFYRVASWFAHWANATASVFDAREIYED